MSQRTLNLVVAACMITITINYLWQSRKITQDSDATFEAIKRLGLAVEDDSPTD